MPHQREGLGGDGHPRRRAILVVDADIDYLTFASVALELDGHDVRSARHGRVARDLLGMWHADLILLDPSTPEIDWLASPADVPTVVMSSCRSLRGQEGFPRCVAILDKPFGPEDLVDAVRRGLAACLPALPEAQSGR